MDTTVRFNKVLGLAQAECKNSTGLECRIHAEIIHSNCPIIENSDGEYEFVKMDLKDF